MKRWWHRYFRTPGELEAMGVVGINMRNARFVLPNNPRRLYDLVDNKIRTKLLAERQGISVPETFGVVRSPKEIRRLDRILGERDSFVVKPARGSGGKGILVISGRDEDRYIKPSGSVVSPDEVRFHLQNIIAGLFSLGGKRDVALIEDRVKPAKVMTELSFQGAPDVRVVIFRGYPVMAMLRASTRESDGRSNLHQGALGIGVDIATGRTVHAIHHGRPVTVHPDLKVPLIGVQLPEWDRILEIAVTCQQMTGLGYLGVDMMIDEERGPIMIEVNARPGLAIQLANGVGLLKRLVPTDARARQIPDEELREKIRFSRNTFAARMQEV
ncbi:alpha-L-glutamate ligase-like protein [Haloferula sp. A504]|uniref:alpha-L-glutamate ligase-like protein n=1 Tax=Haloferula sp. A504 TaxID=3373601 RepID=UPI0031C193DE|nr:alpha-L-glutamate ligase-like protein [Verrucomicrobiaceae bacterium E54]